VEKLKKMIGVALAQVNKIKVVQSIVNLKNSYFGENLILEKIFNE